MRATARYVTPTVAREGHDYSGDYVNGDGVRLRVVRDGEMPVSTATGDDRPKVRPAYMVQIYRRSFRRGLESAPARVTADTVATYLVGYGFARVR